MRTMDCFHKTGIGYSHVLKKTACQDYSASYASENGKYQIAIVADGHGDSTCKRSKKGSRFAAEVTKECLKEYAEEILLTTETEESYYKQLTLNLDSQKEMISHLFGSIMIKWYDKIREDYMKVPEQGMKLKENEENVVHLYGTTLIAALQLPSYLILLQQGDGHCTVFHESSDGAKPKIDQPIPWNEKCYANVTTSLSDEDAMKEFNYLVINTNTEKVLACFLCTDGIEDSYRDSAEDFKGKSEYLEGVRIFCQNLLCLYGDDERKRFDEKLEKLLSGFSEDGPFGYGGSGDDVSVAAIIDEQFWKLHPELLLAYKKDEERYRLKEELVTAEAELNSKKRKHKKLQSEKVKAKKHTEQYVYAVEKFEKYDSEYQMIKRKIEVLKMKIEELGDSEE